MSLSVLGGLAAPLVNFGLDQVFNALTPNEVVEKNKRIDQVQIPQVLEGSSLNIIYGAQNRVAGLMFYCSDLTEIRNQDTYGGKGFTANAQDVITYSYYIDVAIALAANQTGGVTRIWANGRLIYANIGTTTLASSLFSVSSTPTINHIALAHMEIRSPSNGPDLRRFIPGFPVRIFGFANGNNNNSDPNPPPGDNSFMCAATAKRADGSTYARIINQNNVDVAAGPVVTISQDAVGGIGAVITNVNPYYGTSFQNADSVLTAAHAALIPPLPTVNYRGISYMVFRCFLDSFGGNIPSFTFEIPGLILTVEEAIEDILIRAGYLSNEFDVSNISASLSGYVITGPTNLQDALAPLMIAYDLVASVEEDVLVFRGRTSVPFITVDDWSAHEDGTDDFVRDIGLNDVTEDKLPREVVVDYIDKAADYAPGSQREKRVVSVGVVNSEKLNIPVTLTAGQAKTIAQRELYRAWQNRNIVELHLPPKYIRIREHTRIVATINGVTYNVFVTNVDRGYNFVVKVTGVLE
jgi:hypothetical protein